MGFEEFDKSQGGRTGSTEPRISLRKSGTIGINSRAAEAYFDGKSGVVLYYNEDDHQIGLRPADKSETNAYVLQDSSQSTSASVNSSAFMNRYGLVPDQTTHFEAKWHDEEELVYINLDEPIGTYGDPDE